MVTQKATRMAGMYSATTMGTLKAERLRVNRLGIPTENNWDQLNEDLYLDYCLEM
jgi:hypothetical protein